MNTGTYIVWTIFFLVLATTILLYLQVLPKKVAKVQKEGGERRTEERFYIRWLKHNAGQLAIMWTFLLFLPLAFGERGDGGIRDWWWNNFLYTKYSLVLILGFVVFGSMKFHDERNPFRYKLATIGVWIIGLCFLWVLLIGPRGTLNFWRDWNSSTGIFMKAGSTYRGPTTFQAEASKFWYENIPAKEAWVMMDVYRLETTNFRHFNPDGTVVKNVNTDGSIDVGIGQINLTHSAKEIAECNCDVLTLDGNFKVALIIYNKYGPSRWSSYPKVMAMKVTERETIAPVGNWSKKDPIVLDSNCYYEVDREIDAKDEKGVIRKFTPEKVPAFSAKNLFYSVPDEPPGKVVVKCRSL